MLLECEREEHFCFTCVSLHKKNTQTACPLQACFFFAYILFVLAHFTPGATCDVGTCLQRLLSESAHCIRMPHSQLPENRPANSGNLQERSDQFTLRKTVVYFKRNGKSPFKQPTTPDHLSEVPGRRGEHIQLRCTPARRCEMGFVSLRGRFASQSGVRCEIDTA